ncbi:MAG TPA: hypothetical protein VGP36_01090 [Mycobacteriales bacterium]|jgi:hypothetical protein|nr:hypothetical protein [Mycobacteriales bacterium]
MSSVRRVVVPLRVFLVVLFGVLIVLETLPLPGQFADLAREWPDDAYLRWPLTAVLVLGLLMVVLRALLRQATTLRTDLEAVS